MDAEGDKLYTWETEYERTWEAIQEDAQGYLQATTDEHAYKAKRRKLFERPSSVRLGMMRHVFVILDASRTMVDKDLKPDRITCTLKFDSCFVKNSSCKLEDVKDLYDLLTVKVLVLVLGALRSQHGGKILCIPAAAVVLEKFVAEFFDQNPISQLGLIVTRNGKAEKLLELNGNPRIHLKALKEVTSCSGEPSIQNSLEMAMRALKHVPSHGSKEVVVILGALTSCDPGNIFNTIDDLGKQSVRCSIVGLAAEVKLCQTICQRTQGSYSVITDESHFRDLVIQYCRPLPAKSTTEATLMKMGFPKHDMSGPLAACLCHLDQRSPEYITSTGYLCPRCNSKYCELPVECKVCGLTLVLAPHLARSYHHLFPLATFVETPVTERCTCTGCQLFVESKVYVCPDCTQPFCIDCDLYIHETLHNCPGCTSTGPPQ